MLYKLLTCIFVLFSVSGCDWQGNPPKYEIIYNGESKQNQQNKQNQDNYTNEYTIAIVPKVSGIPYFNAVKDGALEAERDLGVNVLYMGPTKCNYASVFAQEQGSSIGEFSLHKHSAPELEIA